MSEWVKIVTLDNEVQAQIAGAILAERGIPHVVRSYHDSAMDGIFQLSRGWGHIEAAPEHREEILTVVGDVSLEPDEPTDEVNP